MGRGIERRNIFLSDEDRNDFITRLGALAQPGDLDVYAWALLPNHFHLLVKTRNRPLSSSMRKLLTGYVVNFNRRHRGYGHLFQNRGESPAGAFLDCGQGVGLFRSRGGAVFRGDDIVHHSVDIVGKETGRC